MDNFIPNTDKLLEDLEGVDPNYKQEIELVEKANNCSISCSIEKHHALQHTFFYEVDFGKEELFYVEIESGINNGSQINHAEWGVNTLSKTKTTQVLKDIVFDEDAFNDWFSGGEDIKKFIKLKAIALFEREKHKLFELHRQQSYDNYVTGGGTIKTDSNYANELSKLSERGVFWKYVYEEQEVDCNFV